MTSKRAPSIPYDTEFLYPRLKADRQFALEYLNACLQDEEDISLFLLALRQVIEAQGISMTKLSKNAGLNRENLYKMLSEKGNPEWRSIKALLDTLGYKITIAG